jgi:hypothetical protein
MQLRWRQTRRLGDDERCRAESTSDQRQATSDTARYNQPERLKRQYISPHTVPMTQKAMA